MSWNFGRRMLDVIWGPADEGEQDYRLDATDAEPEEAPVPPPPPRRAPRAFFNRERDEVVELHPGRTLRAVLRYPRRFAETKDMASLLMQQCGVLVDLTQAEATDRQRIVDFLSGVTHGLHGTPQKVNDLVFFFAPRQVQLEVERLHEGGRDPGYVPQFKFGG
ncbi:MAG: cell division protein SepF [Fimbriimonadaceae bacterium]|nr:cell division protein SepF [Fimbriimonadaceae bacterium]